MARIKIKGNKEKENFRATKEWKIFSKSLREKRPYCECCGCKSSTLQVHHMFGDDDYENLDESRFAVLCRQCHSAVTRLERLKLTNYSKYNPIWIGCFCRFIRRNE